MAIIPDTLGAALAYMKQSLAGAGALKGADGKSAYELAVDNGFEGTEEEWLKSLSPTNIVTVSESPFESVQGVFKMNEIIAGESQQLTTSGKNLLDCSGLTEQTNNGITLTPVYENGMLQYINVNGTATALVNYTVGTTTYIANQEYVLSGCPSGGGGSTYKIKATNDSKYADYGNGVTFSYTEDKSSSVIIVVYSGTTINNIKFYPMLRDSSIGDATYEPYTNGASPNPSYPQEIQKTVVSEIKTHGKNIAWSTRPDIYENAGVTYTTVRDLNGGILYIETKGTATEASTYIFTKIPLKMGQKYIISGCPKGGSDSTYRLNWAYGGNDIGEGHEREYAGSEGQFRIVINANTNVDGLRWYPMMREVGTDPTYEPYTESVIKLSKPVELYGIGDVKDTIENGKVIRRFVKRVFNGSEKWKTSGTLVGRYYLEDMFCKNYGYLINTHAKGVLTTSTILHECYLRDSQAGRLMVNTEFTTFDDWKAHLQDNPMTVVYELAEPITEDLPFADKASLNSLSTYSGITYLEFDSEIEPGFKGETAVTQEGAYILDVLHNTHDVVKDDYAVTSESPITDGYEGRFKVEEIVAGESSQFTTTGKNLLDCSGLSTETKNGGTFTPVYAENGELEYINVNGTFSAQTDYVVNGGMVFGNTNEYTFSTNAQGSDSTAFAFVSTDGQLVQCNDAEKSFVPLGEDNVYTCHIRVRKDQAITNLKFYPMVRLASVTDATYEPYTGGIASPNPSYPQEIKKTVVSEIRTHGENFLDSKSVFTNISGMLQWVYLKLKPNTAYTMSSNIPKTFGAAGDSAYVFLIGGTDTAGVSTSVNGVWNGQNRTFTSDENGHLSVGYRTYGTDFNLFDYWYLLEEGTETTQCAITLSQPIELYGIGDVRDTIEDGKVVRRFASVTLDGSTDEDLRQDSTYIFRSPMVHKGVSYSVNQLCTRLQWSASYSVLQKKDNTFSVSAAGVILRIGESVTTVEELRVWLVEHPITVVYELAEEITEPLPIVDQMALNSLKTFDGVTYLEFDSEIQPTFQAEYGTTKNGGYILEGLLAGRNGELLQERIAALEATLVNNI